MKIEFLNDSVAVGELLPGPVIIITGPTASGKSSVAMKLAQEIGGEIVCADSMQIYKDMNIGTAKPTATDMVTVNHHLFGEISPEKEFSVAQYSKMATQAIHDILSRGKIPIVCGGTGQYISSLISGIQYIEIPTDHVLRKTLEDKVNEFGLAKLYSRLKFIDPESAAVISENDAKRIIRAIEVYKLSGLTKTQINLLSALKGPDFSFMSYCLTLPREELYKNIDIRVDNMISSGLIDEVKMLQEKYSLLSKTSSQAIGYKEVIQYLHGTLALDQAIDKIKQASRNYAKRQITWFKKITSLKFIDLSCADFDYSAVLNDINIL